MITNLGRLYKSTDGGMNFEHLPHDHDITAIGLTNTGVIYIGSVTANSMMLIERSFDGGATWETVYEEGPTINYITDMEYSYIPGTAGLPYFIATTNWKGILKGGGTNWYYSNNGIEYRKRYLRKVCFDKETGYIYVGSDFTLFYSVDNGNTWDDMNMNGVLTQNNLDILKSAEFKIYTGFSKSIWKRINEVWKLKFVNSLFQIGDFDIAYDDFNRLFLSFIGTLADTGGKIYMSFDGGETWELHKVASEKIRLIDSNNKDTAFAMGDVTLGEYISAYRTTNGGLTWVGGPIIQNTETWLTDLSAATGKIAYGASVNRFNNYFFRTFDGENWEYFISPIGKIYSLEAYGRINSSRVFAGTGYKIWRSDDYGDSWREVFYIEGYGINDITSDPEDPAILYAVASGMENPPQNWGYSKLFYSVDLGRVWFEMSFPVPDATIEKIEVDLYYKDTIFVKAENKGIYFIETPWEKDQLTSSSENALYFNGGVKLKRARDTLWVVYESGNGIFVTYSTDNGNTFTPKKEIFDGKIPAIDINPDYNPYIIFVKDDTLLYGVGRISNGWPSEPWLLYRTSEVGGSITSPCFHIRDDGMGFVAFITNFWRELKVGAFNTRVPNPTLYLYPAAAMGCDVRWASLTILPDGNPAVVYQSTDGGSKIIYKYWTGNEWSSPEQVSPTTHYAVHPFLGIKSDGTPCCVWIHNNIVYYSERGDNAWGIPTPLSSSIYISDYPQIHYPEPLIVTWTQVHSEWLRNEVVFRRLTNTGWSGITVIDRGSEERKYVSIECGRILTTPYLFSVFQKKLVPIYDLPFRKNVLVEPQATILYTGEPYQTSFTQYREGTLILGKDEYYQLVDLGDSLVYNIKLPSGTYVITLIAYSDLQREEEVYVNSEFSGVWNLNSGDLSAFITHVPVYDSVLNLKLRGLGSKAVCGLIVILPYRGEGGPHGKGFTPEVNLEVYPTFVKDKFLLIHSVRESSPIKIMLYDVMGRKVSELLKEKVVSPGIYRVELKRPEGLSPGIYFLKINAGNLKGTKKIIFSR